MHDIIKFGTEENNVKSAKPFALEVFDEINTKEQAEFFFNGNKTVKPVSLEPICPEPICPIHVCPDIQILQEEADLNLKKLKLLEGANNQLEFEKNQLEEKFQILEVDSKAKESLSNLTSFKLEQCKVNLEESDKEYNTQIESLNNKHAREIETYKHQIKEFSDSNLKDDQINNLIQEKIDCDNTVDDIQNNLNDCKKEFRNLKKLEIQKSKKIDSLKKENNSFHETKKKLTKCNKNIKNLNSEKSELNNTIHDLQDSIETTKKFSNKLIKQNRNIVETSQSIEAESIEIASNENGLRNTISRLMSEVSVLGVKQKKANSRYASKAVKTETLLETCEKNKIDVTEELATCNKKLKEQPNPSFSWLGLGGPKKPLYTWEGRQVQLSIRLVFEFLALPWAFYNHKSLMYDVLFQENKPGPFGRLLLCGVAISVWGFLYTLLIKTKINEIKQIISKLNNNKNNFESEAEANNDSDDPVQGLADDLKTNGGHIDMVHRVRGGHIDMLSDVSELDVLILTQIKLQQYNLSLDFDKNNNLILSETNNNFKKIIKPKLPDKEIIKHGLLAIGAGLYLLGHGAGATRAIRSPSLKTKERVSFSKANALPCESKEMDQSNAHESRVRIHIPSSDTVLAPQKHEQEKPEKKSIKNRYIKKKKQVGRLSDFASKEFENAEIIDSPIVPKKQIRIRNF